jgi:hypothetical protein
LSVCSPFIHDELTRLSPFFFHLCCLSYGGFLDLADAFKKIVQEKVAAEAILKASTPLEDLGDVDALEAHLQNMSSKNEVTRVFFY